MASDPSGERCWPWTPLAGLCTVGHVETLGQASRVAGRLVVSGGHGDRQSSIRVGGPCRVLRTTRPQPLAPSRGFRLQHWPPLGSLHTGPFARAQLQTDDRPGAGALGASPTWACNVASVATIQGQPLSWGPFAVPGLTPGPQSLGRPPPEVQLLSLPVLSVLRLISPQQPVTLLCTPSPSRRGRPPARDRFCPQSLQRLGCAGELLSCHLAFPEQLWPPVFPGLGDRLVSFCKDAPLSRPKNCSFCHIARLSAQGFLQARVPVQACSPASGALLVPSPAHLLPWHPHQAVVRHPWPPPLSVLGLKRRGAAVPAWPPRRPSLLAHSPCAATRPRPPGLQARQLRTGVGEGVPEGDRPVGGLQGAGLGSLSVSSRARWEGCRGLLTAPFTRSVLGLLPSYVWLP